MFDFRLKVKNGVIMLTFILWIFLFVICWPIAIMALFLYPVVWLLLLPFRLIGITVSAVFEVLHTLLTLPLRILKGPSGLR